ncbi:hypothetical protein RCL_jg4802.t1 [Rhizophagus clarus]|uniref:Uncharacterized protein n=1 Tax=Rhizophagus clarus TaxID=94130 RepID=A0A8H3MI65_9GLOM|nr:hypothetical protein RCL_jg4802.t1 [Rhizophagus clarus]
MCVYCDLENFRIYYNKLEAVTIIIENNGGNIKKIFLASYELDDLYNLFENSLIFMRNIRKNCHSIEYLPLIFSPSKEHFIELGILLKICQILKLLLLILDLTVLAKN